MFTAASIVAILIDLVAIDRPAMQRMIETRFAFDKALLPYPSVLVNNTDGLAEGTVDVTLLGVVNGLVGGDGRVGACYDDADVLVKFRALSVAELQRLYGPEASS